MNYLPRILREDVHSNLSGEGSFPKINFKKLAANRNKRLYLLLNMVKWVFSVFSRKPQKIETGTKQDTPYRECEGSSREEQDEKIIVINI